MLACKCNPGIPDSFNPTSQESTSLLTNSPRQSSSSQFHIKPSFPFVTILTQTGFCDGVRFRAAHDTTEPPQGQNKVFRSTSLSNLGLRCRILNTVVGTLVHYKLVFAAVAAVYFLALYLRYRLRKFRLQRLQVETVYHEVLRNLKKQHSSAAADASVAAYIGLTQLRDLILTSEKNLSRKLALWRQVSARVESNSNVRYHLVEHHGEITKVWEWITDVDVGI